MGGYLFPVKIQVFVHHYFRVRQRVCGEGESDFHRAAGLGRRKGDFGSDLLSINRQRLFGGLVHEDTLEGVFLAGGQLVVGNDVGQSDVAHRHGNLLIVHGGHGANHGLIRLHKGDGLPGVRDVGMGRNLHAIQVQVLEDHHTLTGQGAGVQGVGQLHRTGGRFGGKLGLGGNLFAVHQQGFTGGLVHENARELVGLSRGQTGIGHGIHDGHLLGGFRRVCTVDSGSGADFRYTEGHGLPLVLDIRMSGDFQLTQIEVLKDHHGFTCHRGGIKGIRELDRAGLGFGGELDLSGDLGLFLAN